MTASFTSATEEGTRVSAATSGKMNEGALYLLKLTEYVPMIRIWLQRRLNMSRGSAVGRELCRATLEMHKYQENFTPMHIKKVNDIVQAALILDEHDARRDIPMLLDVPRSSSTRQRIELMHTLADQPRMDQRCQNKIWWDQMAGCNPNFPVQTKTRLAHEVLMKARKIVKEVTLIKIKHPDQDTCPIDESANDDTRANQKQAHIDGLIKGINRHHAETRKMSLACAHLLYPNHKEEYFDNLMDLFFQGKFMKTFKINFVIK